MSRADIVNLPASVPSPNREASESTPSVLPESFWQARSVLAQIAQAARARRVPPSAAFGAVLARLAAMVPPSTCVPALVGTTVPLSTFVAVIAPTGGGKSSAVAVAAELLPLEPAGFIGGLPLGSGEGLVDAFLAETETTTDANGTKIRIRRQQSHGVMFSLDEGRVLGELASRKGSTLLPTLCAAWSGSTLGQANVRGDTHRHLPAANYAVGLIASFQPTRAVGLFDDTDGGTPGRFLWVRALDPNITDTPPKWPGPLSIQLPDLIVMNGRVRPSPLDYANDIAAEVDAEQVTRHRGDHSPAPLDAHRTLSRLKVAGLLTLLDNRNNVTVDDWALAEVVLAASDAARATVLDAARWEARSREESATAKALRRDAALDDDARGRALDRMARAIGRRITKPEVGKMTRRDATLATPSKDRQLATIDEALDHALGLRWIAHDGDTFVPGESRPT